MFRLRKKNPYKFGYISSRDDTEIQVLRLKSEARRGIWLESLRLLRDIILIVAIFVLFGVFVAQPVVVDGSSMVPELHDGERLLVNKLIYYKIESFSWGHIRRGDIVVFWYPDDPNKSFVKRVIGLPGETVEIREGKVYINGSPLSEPYISMDQNRSHLDTSAKMIDKHHYFVMGDNRDNSLDSRTWGLVPEKYIYGKAFFRYWQIPSAGFLNRGDSFIEGRPGDDGENPDPADDDPRAGL